MKKIITGILAMFMVVALSTNVQAQQDVVFDGDAFNVWLKVNSAETQVLAVYFTSNGEWKQFSLIDYVEFEGEGFAFQVNDTQNVPFYIFYYRDEDAIIVTSSDGNTSWTLKRR